MFPILNKYVANELKNSKYCAENYLKEQDMDTSNLKREKKQKVSR